MPTLPCVFPAAQRSVPPPRIRIWILAVALGPACTEFLHAPTETNGVDTGDATSSMITSLPVTAASAEDAHPSGTAGSGTATLGASGDTAPPDNASAESDTGQTMGGTTVGPRTCGDDSIELGEDCDGSELGQATCADEVGFGGELACAEDCTFDLSGCIAGPMPGAGDIVITEIMNDPDALQDALGEWFEVHNPGVETFDLSGCRFDSDNDPGLVVEGPMPLPPGAWVTLARSTEPGFAPDYVYASAIVLGNNADSITLACGATSVDTVAYANGTFPNATGGTMTLNPNQVDATANDDGANWCIGSTTLPDSADLGTPGNANDAC